MSRSTSATAVPPTPSGPAGEFLEALDSVSRGIRDPVAKLRYIRSSLARYQAVDRTLQAIPIPPLRRALYRWLSLEALRPLLTTSGFGVPVVDARTRRASHAGRSGMVLATMAALLAVAATSWRLSHTRVEAPPLVAAAAAAPTLAALPPAEELPALPPGVTPANVWVVEKGTGFEQYSNGLRIDTAFATVGDPRSYRTFAENGGMEGTLESKPVGILFHTSESDVWPLEAGYNENLRDSSNRLLRYIQRNRLYNYVIDRFGRVYRVMDEGSKANHAGNSIWQDQGRVYLNLNHAFLGICFETRWEGGRALPITAAQLENGRSLTQMLRQRYEIAPSMCVAHGLASVNPRKHLIGHHLDWARGFPFEAFGLPDQYLTPAPSVRIFGFSYDGDFLKVLGEPWPGVREAERALGDEAARRNRTVDEIRRERQDLYDRWLEEQTRDQEATASARTAEPPQRGAGG